MGKDTGGPAFPRTQWTGSVKDFAHRDVAGMYLRDYFAGQALVGQCAYDGMEGCDSKLVAACAYEMADAMMKERAK